MKTALHLLFAGSLFLLASCSGGYKLANTAPNDDVYASSGDKQAPTETYVPQEQTNPNIGDNSDRAGQYSDKRVDENGDTYVTNNYYGDGYSFDDYDEDYYYSRNLRRWYEPYYGFGYYSNVYANPYYWGPSFYGSGLSVTLSFGNYYPWYWRPAYYSYYPWYTPYPYYSYYNPYYNPYGCGAGYNAGYWNGYNDGYWGNPYGYNGYYNYYDNGGGYYGYGNSNWSNTYYGHRGGNIFSNTNTVAEAGGLGGRLESVKQDDAGRVNADVKGRTTNTNTTPTSVGKTETGKQDAGNASERYTGKDVQKETGAQTGRPNTQQPTKSNEPTNTQRVNGFDTNPNIQKNNTEQPHKGSTSIDVNPNTQVKPQPNVRDNNQEMPQPQPRYQWESPAQNEQPRTTQPAQPSQPRYEQPQPRSYEAPQNDNRYQAPRNNDTYQQPRQQDDIYVPRSNEPTFQAPRNETPRFEGPRQTAPTPQYEAPRQQPRVETPKQSDGPVFKSAPSDINSRKDRSDDSPRSRRPH